jgi:hypothetical protein
MANWIIQLDVSDIWESAEDDMEVFLRKLIPRIKSISIPETKMKRIYPHWSKEDNGFWMTHLAGIIERLEDFQKEVNDYEDPQDAFMEFNDIWTEMYDWADQTIIPGYPMCWIKTF